MAFGQIDPARLDGDALRQWYLRSPADIEEEKRRAAARAYDAFFSQADDPQSDDSAGAVQTSSAPSQDPDSDAALIWRQIGPDRFRSERAPPDSMPVSGTDSNGFQLASATFPDWGRWPILGCVNCHNPQTGDLLPGNSPAPRPPMFSPRDGDARGYGGSEPGRGDKKECDQQHESDSRICFGLPNPRDVPICMGTAMDRYAYCLRPDGTIGHPHLETKGGRRP